MMRLTVEPPSVTFLALLALAATAVAQSDPGDMGPYEETVPGTDVKVAMVPVPAGTSGHPAAFIMGSPEEEEGRRPDEGPPFEVVVEPFWMGRCEVTWDAYDAFRREYSIHLDEKLTKGEVPDARWADAVSLPTPLWEQDAAPILRGLGTKGGYPVADVSQYAAMQFTKWLSKKTGRFYRLPTEAEWEYAARAGTSTAYCFGDDPAKLAEHAWFFDTSAYDDPDRGYPGVGAGYRRVGLKKANPWGLHDMYGNVSEWVVDQYAADAYARFSGRRVSWREAVSWPTKIFPCVVRGGNWESDPAGCRSASRLASSPKWQYRDPQIPKSIWWYTDAFHVGFRILRPLVEPPEEEKLRFWEPQAAAIQEVLAEGGKQVRAVVRTPEKKPGR